MDEATPWREKDAYLRIKEQIADSFVSLRNIHNALCRLENLSSSQTQELLGDLAQVKKKYDEIFEKLQQINDLPPCSWGACRL